MFVMLSVVWSVGCVRHALCLVVVACMMYAVMMVAAFACWLLLRAPGRLVVDLSLNVFAVKAVVVVMVVIAVLLAGCCLAVRWLRPPRLLSSPASASLAFGRGDVAPGMPGFHW